MRRLAAILCVSCCPYSFAEWPAVEAAAEQAQFSLLSQGSSVCCAVAIGPHQAFSAAHCLAEERVQYVFDGRLGEARLRARDPDSDLVLLDLFKPAPAWASLPHEAELWPGAAVFTRNGWSYVIDPNEWSRSYSGTITRSVVVDTEPLPGLSGSALLDRYGRLVGICRGEDASGQHAAYAPVSAIVALWSGVGGSGV